MTDKATSLTDLLACFGQAFFRVDRERLAACTTDDFEWHQHTGPSGPDGLVLRGVDEVITEIERRKTAWSNVRYSDFGTHIADNMITSTFTVTGTDEAGRDFHVRAVDLYPVRDGKVARKDSFWKQVAP